MKKNLKKKLLAGVMSLGLIMGGIVNCACGSGGPNDPPLQGSNIQITQTFHC